MGSQEDIHRGVCPLLGQTTLNKSEEVISQLRGEYRWIREENEHYIFFFGFRAIQDLKERTPNSEDAEIKWLCVYHSVQNSKIKWKMYFCCSKKSLPPQSDLRVCIAILWFPLVFYYISRKARNYIFFFLNIEQKQNLNCKNAHLKEIQLATVFYVISQQDSFCSIFAVRAVWCQI